MGETKRRKITKRHFRALCSAVLIITLTVTGIPVGFTDKAAKASAGQQQDAGMEKEPEIVKELTEERTENTNTYLMSDGSKQLEIYSENIRYEKDGELVEYDPSLTALDKTDKRELNEILGDGSAGKYTAVNTEGDSRQYFPKELASENGVVMKYGKYVLEMAPVIEENDKYTEESKEIQ